ncbi:MAG: type I-B CRISPR-associated endonuclease Cas1b [Candidatus Omnitrophica bacterium]|nr:type I-B CRISPR-associated endonuclease Cas1b [Candidatus Omnitrophota bacterium]
MKNFYILKSGELYRKSNTVYFSFSEKTETINRSLPINSIEAIYLFGEVKLNTKVVNFIASNNIIINFYNYYGFYTGSFIPKKSSLSGFLLVNQVKAYSEKSQRLKIAKEFVLGAIHNVLKNLLYYQKQKKEVTSDIESIKILSEKIDKINSIDELMAIEGNVKNIYYHSFEKFLGENFKLTKRTRQPPTNMINCLISFGNSLLYTTCLREIYHTQLDPTISFLHEPGERRYSLSLDLAEVFKPIIIDKIIFKLINNQMIKEKHFLKELNYVYLNESGKKIFIQEYENKLAQTVKHYRLKRSVSYKTLIRFECYKLIKHLVGDEEYKSLKMYW